MSEWSGRISRALEDLGALFHPNELAYLALTRKVEDTVRDAVAFSLHCAWSEQESLLVCREWKRVDLAIIKDSSPILMLEVKAVYSFDVLTDRTPHTYPDMMLQDVRKVAPHRKDGTEVFTLLLVTHPHSAPEAQYRDAVKYLPDVVRHAKRNVPLAEADTEITRRLADHPRAASGVIEGGTALGMRVSIAYWLFGPYQNAV